MSFIVENSRALLSPFHFGNYDHYCYWRDNKLKDYPESINDLLVEIDDPRLLTKSEFDVLQQRCRKANMALYISSTGTDPDPEIPLSMGRQLISEA